MSVPVIRILTPGPSTALQDRGRHGYLQQGISASGSFDRLSAARANHAVGNDPNAPLLEILLGGLRAVALEPLTLVITGVDAPITIESKAGQRTSSYSNTLISLKAGDTFSLGHAEYGLRAYLAIHGGFDAPQILGSSSTDTLSGIGPAPLKAGDVLMRGEWASPNWYPTVSHLPTLWRRVPEEELKVLIGPHHHWFSTETLLALTSQRFEVTSQSNRIGLRLRADQPLLKVMGKELPSQGMVRGAIQVPPNGHPVIFGPDHPVTGGYPVIAVLTSRSCDRAAQLPPGTIVRLRAQKHPD